MATAMMVEQVQSTLFAALAQTARTAVRVACHCRLRLCRQPGLDLNASAIHQVPYVPTHTMAVVTMVDKVPSTRIAATGLIVLTAD